MGSNTTTIEHFRAFEAHCRHFKEAEALAAGMESFYQAIKGGPDEE